MSFIPKGLIQKTADAVSDYVPIVGPAVKYSRKAMIVTKITNPVKASTRAVGYLVSACSGPIIKYPILCSFWASTGLLGLATGNPVLIGMSLEFAEIILNDE